MDNNAPVDIATHFKANFVLLRGRTFQFSNGLKLMEDKKTKKHKVIYDIFEQVHRVFF